MLTRGGEQEFNRQLSGFEIEMISGWIHYDKYPQELIVAALKVDA